ncbi:MAG: single-stranded-DNA-specific exonuclease RecJ [Deltaproteobacteria bacterium]|nr:single-stranded-DNA-specific exonuclease RecJ [Deltaproteobacteria bacterium]
MEWNIIPFDSNRAGSLAQALNLPSLVAQLLLNRGLDSPDQARDFLAPALLHLPDPALMKDMDKAVNRILKAIQRKERIAVFGDYDADGVTATAILLQFLTPFFPDILFYIPHRVREGYGLSIPGLRGLKEQGVTLIITVDCGISNHLELEWAEEQELDVIVTDHHQISKKGIPPALAVLNPKQEGCYFPFKELAGVGVAFYLLIALRQALDLQGFFPKGKPNLKAYLDLVALGTVADVVPLLGVNRILVREGLEVMTQNPQVGLTALKEISGITAERTLSSFDIAFRLAPRINALGRVQDAEGGVRLLTTNDASIAVELARLMNQENSRRQIMEQVMLKEIDELLQTRSEMEQTKSLVLGSETWHRGVLGLVASRLAERLSKPVFLFTLEGETAHGSGRSVEGFHLFKGLENLEEFLLGFGGHAAAAGATLMCKDLPSFEKAFESLVQNSIPESAFLPSLTIEGETDFPDLVKELVPYLPFLGPFGSKNPEPLLVTRQILVKTFRPVGKGHLRLRLEQKGIFLNGIGFGLGDTKLAPGGFIDLAYTPYISEYGSSPKLELRIKEIRIITN